jgi:ABC-type nitrate/sulfonate/bicarbonate transport system substrate-binding protein
VATIAKVLEKTIAAAMIGAWSAQAVTAQTTLNLRYAQAYSAAHSIFALPVSVAESEGFFAREGLGVQVVIPIPGGSDKMIAALHDDWADVTHVVTPFLISCRACRIGRSCDRRRV